jgi:hypothetical protein
MDGTPSPGILKRRSTTKDAGAVAFSFTEEQADKQQRADRREKERLARRREEVRLREVAEEEERERERKEQKREERRRREEFEAEEAERQERDRKLEEVRLREEVEEEERRRERKERKERKREEQRRREESEAEEAARETSRQTRRQDDDRQSEDRSSSSWVAPAVAAIGTAAVAGAVADSVLEDNQSTSNRSRYEERREKRRSERRRASESLEDVTESRDQEEVEQDDEDDNRRKEKRIAKIAASRIARSTSPTYDSYVDFFKPDGLDEDDSSKGIAAAERQNASDSENSIVPPVTINIIGPTPPASHDGSVRDVHSPIPAPEPTIEEESGEETAEVLPDRPAGSRVSWGEHRTHEYEVETPLSEEEPENMLDDHDEFPLSREVAETPTQEIYPITDQEPSSRSIEKRTMPGGFEDDTEFAATLAAGAQMAGFDSSVVVNDASYYKRDSPPGSELDGTYHNPTVESVTDIGDRSASKFRKDKALPSRSEKFMMEESVPVDTRSASGADGRRHASIDEDDNDNSRSVVSAPTGEERKKSKKSKKSSKRGSDPDSESEKRSKSSSAKEVTAVALYEDRTSDTDIVNQENDADKSQPVSAAEDWEEDSKEQRRRKSKRSSKDPEFFDDVASIAASAAAEDSGEDGKEQRRRKTKRSSKDRDFFEDAVSVAASAAVSAPGADEMDKYRSRRSKKDTEDFEDDNRSLPDVDNDGEKRKKRRSKRHSGAFDDTQSVTSSPARIDETREGHRSRDPSLSKEKEKEKEKDKDQDKDKKSGGFFNSLFGSKSNPDLSSSSSAKPEVRSEVGVDDYNKSERRRKKKSSGRDLDTASEGARSSLDLSQLDNADEGEGGDNDSQVSRRRRKRRDKYEEIVGSSRDASAKVDF